MSLAKAYAQQLASREELEDDDHYLEEEDDEEDELDRNHNNTGSDHDEADGWVNRAETEPVLVRPVGNADSGDNESSDSTTKKVDNDNKCKPTICVSNSTNTSSMSMTRISPLEPKLDRKKSSNSGNPSEFVEPSTNAQLKSDNKQPLKQK